ncbi:MAG: hypothetical protein HXX08_02850 [Chloroflexi bacterium]|uniref:Penicillin-binding protein transpeptidase domain-containing protein n=1 Tax=Candidatus Chlorohelix allophototropha TaxID=3003348 RepID=A0A8T7LV87_9CHLR|nr:hypothetical protein [Chloroflexota bacterium]WJW66676.1 hypothetical protein OZ401_002489 [Chloroflexota bacterium L227-S17]
MNPKTIRYLSLILAAGIIGFGLSFGFLFGPDWDANGRSDSVWLICMLVTGLLLLLAFWYGNAPIKKDASSQERIAHNTQRAMTFILAGFILLSFQLLRNQIVITDEISKPYFTPKNELVQDPRIIRQQLTVQRGTVRDTFGNPLVSIEVKDGVVRRTYLNPYISPLVGYYSPLQFGSSGLEASYDDYLSGRSGTNPFVALTRDLTHQPIVGNDLYLSIVPEYQELAQQQLGTQDGAIVLMDAKSGEILAMVGNPHFDPAQLAFDPTVADDLWDAQTKEIQKRWNALRDDPKKPLLTRPTQGLYIPGSTFKTLSLSALLDLGKATPDTLWKDEGKLTVDGAVFNDPNRPDKTRTDWTTTEGYIFSLNAVFGQIGLAIGGADELRYMERFGFNTAIPFDIPVEKSRPFLTTGFLDKRPAQASTGFGQGEILVTPLHWAMLAASFARDDGALPKPILVKEIRTREKVLVKATKPEAWLKPLLPETSKAVRDIMVKSATNGYVGLNGGGLPGSGAIVGGKTGTAEVNPQQGINNGWYIAWATKGDRAFSIAVVIDNKRGAEGLTDAMPKANTILKRVLSQVK